MKARTFIFTATFVLAAAPAFAQGGRPGGGQGQGQRPAQGQGQAQQRGPGGSEQGRGTMDRDRDRDRDRQRIHATDKQRDQFRACTQSQDRVRTQARDMAGFARRQGNSDELRRQRNQLREQVRTMQQEHHRLMQGLNPEQQVAARLQIREMQRVEERLQSRMMELDRAVDTNPFSFRGVSEQAREVERAMKEWQKQHRKLGNETGIEF